jgi:hypothetical protein
MKLLFLSLLTIQFFIEIGFGAAPLQTDADRRLNTRIDEIKGAAMGKDEAVIEQLLGRPDEGGDGSAWVYKFSPSDTDVTRIAGVTIMFEKHRVVRILPIIQRNNLEGIKIGNQIVGHIGNFAGIVGKKAKPSEELESFVLDKPVDKLDDGSRYVLLKIILAQIQKGEKDSNEIVIQASCDLAKIWVNTAEREKLTVTKLMREETPIVNLTRDAEAIRSAVRILEERISSQKK